MRLVTKPAFATFLAAALGTFQTAMGGSLFVMSNSKDGNEILSYERDETSGKLSLPLTRISTGGIGGLVVDGNGDPAPQDDPLGSQDALVKVGNGCIIGVNAGSDTLSSFAINGSGLKEMSVVGSGGSFPVSITHHDNLVYVLNAGGTGSIAGFEINSCGLTPKPRTTRSLGLRNRRDPPFFVVSPAQIGFSPNGKFLVITIKGVEPEPGNGEIKLFRINPSGRPSRRVSTIANGLTPFSFDFDDSGNLLVVEAFGTASTIPTGNAGAVSSYGINSDGSLTVIDGSVGTGETTSCWLRHSRGCVITTNNGGNSLSTLEVDDEGFLSLVAGVATVEVNAPIDMSFSDDGRFLYVLSTGHTLQDENQGQPAIFVFEVDKCSLSHVQTISDGLPNEDDTVFGVVGLAVN